MLQKISLVFMAALCSLAVSAQNATPPKAPVVNQQPVMPAQPSVTYKKLPSGLQWAFINDKPGTVKPQEGDQISLNMLSVCNNRLMYSTAQAFKGKPGVYGVAKPAFKGDLIEAIMFMTAGDSMVCLVDADALYKNSKIKKPDFIKTGDKVQYFIKLVSIKPKELVQKEQQAAFMKQMNEQMAKQKAEAAKLVVKDDKTLQAYFTKKKITPVKTASGLYYTIKEEGSGERAMAGDTVTMNYTGTLLNGTKFDSNEDTAFHHVAPYTFVLGRGTVIKGWDEGIALLKTGSKATFYIPSGMAYGAQVRPGSAANPKGIPANSILLFDVQLMKSVHPVPPAPAPIEPKKDSVSNPLIQEHKIDTLASPVPKKEN